MESGETYKKNRLCESVLFVCLFWLFGYDFFLIKDLHF